MMTAGMDPARKRSSGDEQPSAWGWGRSAWGWGADQEDPTVDAEQDPTDGYTVTSVADTGPAAGSSASLIVRFLSEFLTE
jgi:hypothetical protein